MSPPHFPQPEVTEGWLPLQSQERISLVQLCASHPISDDWEGGGHTLQMWLLIPFTVGGQCSKKELPQRLKSPQKGRITRNDIKNNSGMARHTAMAQTLATALERSPGSRCLACPNTPAGCAE